MKTIYPDWQVGYTGSAEESPAEWMPAAVPGAVQSDYARYKGWPPFYEGENFRDYAWMEDVYWVYRTRLDFAVGKDEQAILCFAGIDYRYQIRVEQDLLCEGEGMFHPVQVDVTAYAGRPVTVEVLLYPVPKADDSNSRTQVRYSCKTAAPYGWDWCPRLVSSGLWDEVCLQIVPACRPENVQISYRLNEQLDRCGVQVEAVMPQDTVLVAVLTDADANPVAQVRQPAAEGITIGTLELKNPRLWQPNGYGKPYRYTLTVSCEKEGRVTASHQTPIGFRRSRLVMNQDSWGSAPDFPKSRCYSPATLEINGRRIFAKGSNWVNAQVMPGEITPAMYRDLLMQVKNANMNILRVWGGGIINKEVFYDLCDELGIMVWQEFPLACNEYPDDEGYLAVLEQEATAIVRRLRTHPCVVLWCGGNELFNSWSRMTEQHHALRLLDGVCYQQDPMTPYMMTSPMSGMAHGHYINYDEEKQQEFITTLTQSHATAYTEFGCPGMSPVEQLRLFMSEEQIADCSPDQPVWVAHHAFGAWTPQSWCRIPEAEYYFGGYASTEDLIGKTDFIQSMCYRSAFEEMRRQWPRCSMALNWCLNEPWPTAANNSLIAWPCKPKTAYYAVRQALRPVTASLQVHKHLWHGGEQFAGQIWMLNDSPESLSPRKIRVFYTLGEKTVEWGTVCCPAVDAQQNVACGEVRFPLPSGYTGTIGIRLEVEGASAENADYTYLCRSAKTLLPAVPVMNL